MRSICAGVSRGNIWAPRSMTLGVAAAVTVAMACLLARRLAASSAGRPSSADRLSRPPARPGRRVAGGEALPPGFVDAPVDSDPRLDGDAVGEGLGDRTRLRRVLEVDAVRLAEIAGEGQRSPEKMSG